MGLQINTNVAALNAYRNLTGTQSSMQTSLERLSSGLRINRAADDAAGLAISEKLRSQVNGLNQAQANAQDGVSLIQTAEGALNEVHSILQRMRTLAVQSASDTNTNADRAQIQKEIAALNTEVKGISTRTQFNGMNLLDGTFKDKQLQIGANQTQTMGVDIQAMSADALSLTTGGTKVSAVNGIAADYKTVTISTVGTGATTTAFTDVVAADGTGKEGGMQVPAGTYTVSANAAGNLEVYRDSVRVGSVNNAVAGPAAVGEGMVLDNGLVIDVGEALGQGDSVTFSQTNFTSSGTAGALTVASQSGNVTAGTYTISGDTATTGLTLLDRDGKSVGTVAGSSITFDALHGGGSVTFSAALANANRGAVTISAYGSGIDLSSKDAAVQSLKNIDDAIQAVSDQRSALGALQNRLDHTVKNLGVSAENLAASESRIRDTDMAKEMTNFTRSQILQQAGVSMLAQANQSAQSVLKLLG